MTISTKDTYQRSSEIIASVIDNETVMMDKDFENYYGLQAIGTEVWSLLESPASVEEIAKSLVQRYDVSLEQCIADLKPLMEDLIENKMIMAVS